jgi:hypothetical protein
VRLFTPDEANAALADVRPLAERLVEANVALRAKQERLAELNARIVGNGGGIDRTSAVETRASADRAAAEVAAAVDDLIALGVQVKDLDRGLVDFPARHPSSGETVLLCWHVGEERVAFWHGADEGFAGRKPLPF